MKTSFFLATWSVVVFHQRPKEKDSEFAEPHSEFPDFGGSSGFAQ